MAAQGAGEGPDSSCASTAPAPSVPRVIWESERKEDPLAEVRHVLRVCVHAVALRCFIEANAPLFAECEAFQTSCWARDERRFQSARQRLLSGSAPSRAGSALKKRESGGSAGSSASSESSAARQRRRAAHRASEAAAAEKADVITLAATTHSLKLGAPAVGSRRLSRKAAHHSGGLHDAIQFASYADSLLPMSPAKSQFVFELENPLQLHAQNDADRRLQRRLTAIAQLQAETLKLERSARADRAKTNAIATAVDGVFPSKWDSGSSQGGSGREVGSRGLSICNCTPSAPETSACACGPFGGTTRAVSSSFSPYRGFHPSGDSFLFVHRSSGSAYQGQR
ncbi:hypothetical protein AB1Y20_010620 [Prymnesium parvum]|uniref:Uncharacterized protein n=1 Tax=Prymnesium parvum TaxID=97485 RepID=A0AB34IP38_PRYPA